MTPMAGCADCGLEYGGAQWIEAVVPDRVWNVIRPADSAEAGGILCISCIARRLRLIPKIGRVPMWLCGTEPLAARSGDPGEDVHSLAMLRGWPAERSDIDMRALRVDLLMTMGLCRGLADVEGVSTNDMLSAAIDLRTSNMPPPLASSTLDTWVVECSGDPPWTCHPADLDTSELLEVTVIGNAWRCWRDPATGKLHDGRAYFEAYRREVGR